MPRLSYMNLSGMGNANPQEIATFGDMVNKYYKKPEDAPSWTEVAREVGLLPNNLSEMGYQGYSPNLSAIKLVKKTLKEQAQKVYDMRPTARKNPDGSVSTVLMASAGFDGKYYAFPTLFPKDKNTTDNPESWIQHEDARDAFFEAKKRGEVFEFDSDADAQEFAEGSWKKLIKKKVIK